MAKKKKKMPGLNTSSTADISFMLLIFFLVTTSMDTDMGLARHLPQPPDPDQEDAQVDIKARNILYIRLNYQGQLSIKDETTQDAGWSEFSELRQRVKDFVRNEQNYSKWPEKHVKIIDLLGRCYVTDKHVISVQTDRGTPYDAYFQVQNELVAAYTELRNEISKEKFGREYQYLEDEQKDAIRQYYPQNISEAEPKKYGGAE
jgi:biopolymer transport protein ExbD